MVDIIEEEVELRLIDTRQLVEEAKKLKEAKRIKAEQNKLLKKDPKKLKKVAGLRSKAKEQITVEKIFGKKISTTITETQKKLKNFEKKQKNAKKRVDKIQDSITGRLSGAQSVLGSGGGLSGVSSILTRFGPIGIIVASIVIPLITQFQKQFQRGGVFSIFKKETIQAKTIIDVNELNPIRGGTKFLTDDLRIVQGEPQSSNTQNLKYEHVRFTAQTLGQ